MHIIPDKYQFEARVTITFKKRQDAVFIFVFLPENILIKFVKQNEENIEYKIAYPKIKIKKSKSPDIHFNYLTF